MKKEEYGVGAFAEDIVSILKGVAKRIEIIEKIQFILFKYQRDILQNAKFFNMEKQQNIFAEFETEFNALIEELQKDKSLFGENKQ